MRALPVVAFLFTVVAAVSARADAMDTITFSFASLSIPTYPGLPPLQFEDVDFSAVLPAMLTPVPPPFGPDPSPGFWYNTNGLPFPEQPFGASSSTSFHVTPGGVSFVATENVNFPRAYDRFSLTNASSLYTGPDSAPTLLPGTYDANEVVTFSGLVDLPGTITITPISPVTSPVPEPGSFLLLLSGAAATGAIRSHRRAS